MVEFVVRRALTDGLVLQIVNLVVDQLRDLRRRDSYSLIDHKFYYQLWYYVMTQTYQMISIHSLLISCPYYRRFLTCTVALLDFRFIVTSARVHALTIPGALRYSKHQVDPLALPIHHPDTYYWMLSLVLGVWSTAERLSQSFSFHEVSPRWLGKTQDWQLFHRRLLKHARLEDFLDWR